MQMETGTWLTDLYYRRANYSLLVIPIIARATEEGIRSVPLNLKEGSTALGASRQHTLFHILLPWSYPNIVTGLILGCAEAAGSLATIWFILVVASLV